MCYTILYYNRLWSQIWCLKFKASSVYDWSVYRWVGWSSSYLGGGRGSSYYRETDNRLAAEGRVGTLAQNGEVLFSADAQFVNRHQDLSAVNTSTHIATATSGAAGICPKYIKYIKIGQDILSFH